MGVPIPRRSEPAHRQHCWCVEPILLSCLGEEITPTRAATINTQDFCQKPAEFPRPNGLGLQSAHELLYHSPAEYKPDLQPLSGVLLWVTGMPTSPLIGLEAYWRNAGLPELDEPGWTSDDFIRDFPVDFTLVLENVADPDHGIFAHQTPIFDSFAASAEYPMQVTTEPGRGGGPKASQLHRSPDDGALQDKQRNVS